MAPLKPRSPSFEAENPEPPGANGLFCMATSIRALGTPVNQLCCLKARFVRAMFTMAIRENDHRMLEPVLAKGLTWDQCDHRRAA